MQSLDDHRHVWESLMLPPFGGTQPTTSEVTHKSAPQSRCSHSSIQQTPHRRCDHHGQGRPLKSWRTSPYSSLPHHSKMLTASFAKCIMLANSVTIPPHGSRAQSCNLSSSAATHSWSLPASRTPSASQAPPAS